MINNPNNATYLHYTNLSAYKLSLQLSNYIWSIVIKWANLPKDTIGKQFIRASDSISANIAEGFGRYSKNDKINFYILNCFQNLKYQSIHKVCTIAGFISN